MGAKLQKELLLSNLLNPQWQSGQGHLTFLEKEREREGSDSFHVCTNPFREC